MSEKEEVRIALGLEDWQIKKRRMSGVKEVFYPNGQIQHRCIYKAGKLDGLTEWWSPMGELRSRYVHKHGRPVGFSEKRLYTGSITRYYYGKDCSVSTKDIDDFTPRDEFLKLHNLNSDGTRKQEKLQDFDPIAWANDEVQKLLEQQASKELKDWSFLEKTRGIYYNNAWTSLDETLDYCISEIMCREEIERFFIDLTAGACADREYEMWNKGLSDEFGDCLAEYCGDIDEIEECIYKMGEVLGKTVKVELPRYFYVYWAIREAIGTRLADGIIPALDKQLEESLSHLTDKQLEVLSRSAIPKEIELVVIDTLNLRKEQAQAKEQVQTKEVESPRPTIEQKRKGRMRR